MPERNPATYMMASARNGTIYLGVTSDLMNRVYQHRNGQLKGFTCRYAVKLLVWFEMHSTMEWAIAREKQLKAWRREWKLALIEKDNPLWHDLAEGLGFEPLERFRVR
jgi:putative endonuclease